ncbi:MAG: metal-dependent transcriptional regulator [Calditerrivibrio sp.]|nr:metal-dependent transcriptional regulator [Calditerrivibrio sp.]
MDELTKSLEDYLEMILILQGNGGTARVTDIAEKLNVKKPAVTSALKILSEKDLVVYAPYKEVKLTSKGIEIATAVLEKHNIIKDFFINVLNLDPQKAEEDACRVEHVISEETYKRFSSFLKFLLESDLKCLNIEKFKKDYCH